MHRTISLVSGCVLQLDFWKYDCFDSCGNCKKSYQSKRLTKSDTKVLFYSPSIQHSKFTLTVVSYCNF